MVKLFRKPIATHLLGIKSCWLLFLLLALLEVGEPLLILLGWRKPLLLLLLLGNGVLLREPGPGALGDGGRDVLSTVLGGRRRRSPRPLSSGATPTGPVGADADPRIL